MVDDWIRCARVAQLQASEEDFGSLTEVDYEVMGFFSLQVTLVD